MLIRILNVKPFFGGSVSHRFDIGVQLWGKDFEICGFALCTKGSQTFVMGPSRSYEKDGQTKYARAGGFSDPTHQTNFLGKVKDALDEHLKGSAEYSGPAPSIKDAEIPF